MALVDRPQHHDKAWLTAQHRAGRTANQIAADVGVPTRDVVRALNFYKITKRTAPALDTIIAKHRAEPVPAGSRDSFAPTPPMRGPRTPTTTPTVVRVDYWWTSYQHRALFVVDPTMTFQQFGDLIREVLDADRGPACWFFATGDDHRPTREPFWYENANGETVQRNYRLWGNRPGDWQVLNNDWVDIPPEDNMRPVTDPVLDHLGPGSFTWFIVGYRRTMCAVRFLCPLPDTAPDNTPTVLARPLAKVDCWT